MKILYYDCFAGISGDMNLGAMLDLGIGEKHLFKELAKLPIHSFKIKAYKDQRRGITGTKVDVLIPFHKNKTSRYVQKERTYRDIVKMIHQSDLSANVKAISLRIFTRLAEAEGKIHGRKTDDVHFHEIGAVDSIVDIIGGAICLDFLKVDKVISSPVQVGSGVVHCSHGTFPVPAPATAEILQGIPMKTGLVPFEAATPTGAAIIASTATAFTEKLEFTPLKIGYGLGSNDSPVPNVLRLFLGETTEHAAKTDHPDQGEAVMIESNIDDMHPELYEALMDEFFSAGAQDVFFTPIIMKKTRPAITVSVLCDVNRRKVMEDIFWTHSSTFGLRSYHVIKSMLQREIVKVKTGHGDIRVKRGYLNGKMIKSKPEYEDCRKLAKKRDISIQDIYKIINRTQRTAK